MQHPGDAVTLCGVICIELALKEGQEHPCAVTPVITLDEQKEKKKEKTEEKACVETVADAVKHWHGQMLPTLV